MPAHDVVFSLLAAALSVLSVLLAHRAESDEDSHGKSYRQMSRKQRVCRWGQLLSFLGSFSALGAAARGSSVPWPALVLLFVFVPGAVAIIVLGFRHERGGQAR